MGWPDGTFPPKLHMLEDHAIDFVCKWKLGFGVYGEQGGESIHNEFNNLRNIYCRMQPSTRRLESMLHEHYRRVHPNSKSIKDQKKYCRKRKLDSPAAVTADKQPDSYLIKKL